MMAYMFRRLLATIPVLIVTSIILFVLMRVLPGDPITMIVGEAQGDVSPEVLDRLRDRRIRLTNFGAL
jgi:ABC-type dipeptide/oligopeptide/nickel transport system permease component